MISGFELFVATLSTLVAIVSTLVVIKRIMDKRNEAPPPQQPRPRPRPDVPDLPPEDSDKYPTDPRL